MPNHDDRQLPMFVDLQVADLRLPDTRLDIYRQIEAATSARTAELFEEAVGGLAVYVPAVADADHWLARLVGRAEAQTICDVVTDGFGLTRDFPVGRNSAESRMRAKIVELLQLGTMSQNEIAATVGCNRSTVSRTKRLLVKAAKRLKP